MPAARSRASAALRLYAACLTSENAVRNTSFTIMSRGKTAVPIFAAFGHDPSRSPMASLLAGEDHLHARPQGRHRRTPRAVRSGGRIAAVNLVPLNPEPLSLLCLSSPPAALRALSGVVVDRPRSRATASGSAGSTPWRCTHQVYRRGGHRSVSVREDFICFNVFVLIKHFNAIP